MASPLLEVRELHVSFRTDSLWDRVLQRGEASTLRAVDGVNLEVFRGEAVGLVGESGCGKSTLARCIVGLYQPSQGEVLFDGKRQDQQGSSADRRRIQMIFQDPYTSLNPRMTVEQMIMEMLRVHRIVPRDRVDAHCSQLLHLVGLGSELLGAYPRSLSGGQRQRVSIARALALEPELLLADEPVSALDVSVQATVLNLLADLRGKLGLTMLLIAHNLAVVRHVCDRVAVMYAGRIVETAETHQLFAHPAHPYTMGLLSAVPSLVPGKGRGTVAVVGDPPSPFNMPAGCHFHPRCPWAQDICRSIDPSLVESPVTPGHAAACHFAWMPPPRPHSPFIEQSALKDSTGSGGRDG